MPAELTIGLDVGGTKMAFAVADRQGRVQAQETLPTHSANSPAHTLDRIAAQLKQHLRQFPHIAGIGIGIPGPVDARHGIALNAVNLGWQDVAVRAELSQRLASDLPIYIENDVNAGAIGEQRFGAAQGIADFVYLALGTGLGGAVMHKGRLLRGTAHSEMEIGHVSIDPLHGRRCGCGLRGCIEMSAAGKGWVANARQHYAAYPQTQIRAEHITTREIIRCAQAGDALARFVLDEAARALGIACAWCTNIFNPAQIILGGGLLQASYPLLQTQLLQSIQERSLPQNFAALTVAPARLNSAALGASALFWHHQDSGADSTDSPHTGGRR